MHLGPGTSLRHPAALNMPGMSQGIRPLSQSGRPLSGFLRPGTMGGRPKTIEQAIRTPRSLMTARWEGGGGREEGGMEERAPFTSAYTHTGQ